MGQDNKPGPSGKVAHQQGLCWNGCGKPIQPPSLVVCADCLKQMEKNLRSMLDDFEDPLTEKPREEDWSKKRAPGGPCFTGGSREA